MQISAVCLIQQVSDGGWAGSTASFTCLLQQVLFLTHAHFEALSPLQRQGSIAISQGMVSQTDAFVRVESSMKRVVG